MPDPTAKRRNAAPLDLAKLERVARAARIDLAQFTEAGTEWDGPARYAFDDEFSPAVCEALLAELREAMRNYVELRDLIVSINPWWKGAWADAANSRAAIYRSALSAPEAEEGGAK